jgi:hypothetical protein
MTMASTVGNITTMGSTAQDFMVDITTMVNTAKPLMVVIMLERMVVIMAEPPLL